MRSRVYFFIFAFNCFSSSSICAASLSVTSSPFSFSHENVNRSFGSDMLVSDKSACTFINMNVCQREISQNVRARFLYPFVMATISHHSNLYRNVSLSMPISPTKSSYSSWAVMRFLCLPRATARCLRASHRATYSIRSWHQLLHLSAS